MTGDSHTWENSIFWKFKNNLLTKSKTGEKWNKDQSRSTNSWITEGPGEKETSKEETCKQVTEDNF